jgi:hypothetical protein
VTVKNLIGGLLWARPSDLRDCDNRQSVEIERYGGCEGLPSSKSRATDVEEVCRG